MNNIRIVALLLLIANCNIVVQSQNFDKLDHYFEKLNDNNKFMGNVSIFRDGIEIYSKSVGYADIDTQIPNTKFSKSCIGSISKTFTAVMVFQAIEAGKLSLSDNLGKYFPQIKNAEKITIAHLLGHRSGIHNYTDDGNIMEWSAKTRIQMLGIIAEGKSDFEPDATADYSNSNYVLLSYILEEAYGKSYAAILTDQIARPLSLGNTYFGKSTIDTDYNECNSYLYNDRWQIHTVTELSVTIGAGCIVSNPEDINKFADALFNGKLISASSLSTMLNVRDDYGMGISSVPYFEKRGYGHRGGIDGFNSMFIYMPGERISYALTSNGLNFNFIEIHLAVLNCIYGNPFDIPNFDKISINPVVLDKYTGVYTSTQIPLEVAITKDNNSLLAQATGQPPLLLENDSENVFRFTENDIIIEFNAEKATMVLIKGEDVLYLKKMR